MKAESQLGVAPESHVHEDHATYNQGYINLLKACWILTDIIAIHPQRAHMGASNDRRAYHIQRLTQGATSKLNNTLSTMTFQLEDLLTCTLDIWNLPPSTALTPRRRNIGDQPELKWQTPYGEILFQKFAEFRDDKLERSVECLVIIVIPSEQFMNALSLNLIVQNSMGQDLYKHQSTCNDFLYAKDLPIRFFAQQDERLLDCILSSLLFFEHSPNPLPMDASMIYSAALLGTCAGAGQSLLDSDFQSTTTNKDIDALARSRQEFQIQPTTHTSSILQQIVDRIVEYIKRCSGGFPTDFDRMFWMQAHHCDWMLIYWLGDTFEAFSELFEAIGIHSPDFHPVSENCLIISSLLRDDTEFPRKFLSVMNSKLDWTLKNIDILLVAIRSDNITLLNTAVKKTEGIESTYLIEAWRLAYTQLKWDAMDALLSAPNVDLFLFLHEALLWLVETDRRDKLQMFSDFLRLSVSSLANMDDSKPPTYDRFNRYLYHRIAHDCAELIYENSYDLELFLDIVQRLGVMYLTSPRGHIQLAIVPALASRKFSPLKLLYEEGDVSSSRSDISLLMYDTLGLRYISLKNTLLYHVSSSYSLSPLGVAIAFVSDLEIVEYLCRTDTFLTRLWFDETLQNLHLTTSIADARKQNCNMKGIFYQLYTGKEGKLRLDKLDGPIHGENIYRPVAKIWQTTGRIIFEGDCRHLYNIADVSSGLTWQAIQNALYPAELKDAPIPLATTWPEPLSTQESWDHWRLKVIEILEKSWGTD
ncbi:hypothetical protein J3E69DRAFT_328647 [Trichoderma sp. SZMC 28015]